MNAFLAAIKKFFANHSISAKSVSTAWVFVTGMWYFSPPFHDYVMNAYGSLPKGIHGIIAGVIVPALIFWRTQKKTTVSAEVAPGQSGVAAAEASVAKTPEPPTETK